MTPGVVPGQLTAVEYISQLTTSERCLMVEWLGSGKIAREQLRRHFSALYDYSAPMSLQLPHDMAWVNDYFVQYVRSKIANAPSQQLQDTLAGLNADAATFEAWRDSFKTVKTLLHHRHDIDVVYWIDGLGCDWIPLVTAIVMRHAVDGVYQRGADTRICV